MSTGGLTAPYLETWRTNKEASLNSGRGTIVHERAGGGGTIHGLERVTGSRDRTGR